MILRKPDVSKKKLVLGDYITVHVTDTIEDQPRAEVSYDILARHAALFDRMLRDRKELRNMRLQSTG